MHACMCVCPFACMYACMYACVYVCKYVCLDVCVYVCTYVCMYVCHHHIFPCLRFFAYVRTSFSGHSRCVYVCMRACLECLSSFSGGFRVFLIATRKYACMYSVCMYDYVEMIMNVCMFVGERYLHGRSCRRRQRTQAAGVTLPFAGPLRLRLRLRRCFPMPLAAAGSLQPRCRRMIEQKTDIKILPEFC